MKNLKKKWKIREILEKRKHKHDNLLTDHLEKTDFQGYENFDLEGKLLAIFVDGEENSSIKASNKGIIVSDKTSFYPEGGGEVADTGFIKTSNACAKVVDVQKKNDIIFHYVEVTEGEFVKGSVARFVIDLERRLDIQRNHSATHLLDKALKNVLGQNINQAGSLVDEDKLRFDFTYNKALSNEELRKIEEEINAKIREQLPVKKEYMDYKKSEELGAVALFEDKYKDIVRVVSMGDYSIELCGGCHVNNTAEVLMFKIKSESSAAAGVRRIEAITGRAVFEELISKENAIKEIANDLDANINNIKSKINSLKSEIASKDSEIKRLKSQSNKDVYSELKSKIEKVNGVNLLIAKFDNASVDELRELENKFKNEYDNLVIIFATVSDKIIFTVSVDDNLTDKYNAGKIVREIAQITGGNGGGKKNFAQAGGSDISALDKALKRAYEIIKE